MYLASKAVEHEIGRMPIPQAQDVTDHAHHCQRAGVARAPLQPGLAILRLEPQHLVENMEIARENIGDSLCGQQQQQ